VAEATPLLPANRATWRQHRAHDAEDEAAPVTASSTHRDSYALERSHRRDTIALWRKISTVEDPQWTRPYHANDPAQTLRTCRGGSIVSAKYYLNLLQL